MTDKQGVEMLEIIENLNLKVNFLNKSILKIYDHLIELNRELLSLRLDLTKGIAPSTIIPKMDNTVVH